MRLGLICSPCVYRASFWLRLKHQLAASSRSWFTPGWTWMLWVKKDPELGTCKQLVFSPELGKSGFSIFHISTQAPSTATAETRLCLHQGDASHPTCGEGPFRKTSRGRSSLAEQSSPSSLIFQDNEADLLITRWVALLALFDDLSFNSKSAWSSSNMNERVQACPCHGSPKTKV